MIAISICVFLLDCLDLLKFKADPRQIDNYVGFEIMFLEPIGCTMATINFLSKLNLKKSRTPFCRAAASRQFFFTV